MKLTAIRRAELARDAATDLIFSRTGLDVEDQLAATPDGESGDVWVSVRVLVPADEIERRALVAARPKRRARKGGRR